MGISYEDEVAAHYRESPEYHDPPIRVCSGCADKLTEHNTSGDDDTSCDDCWAQGLEASELREVVGRVCADLAEALDEYHEHRRTRVEMREERLRYKRLRDLLAQLKEAVS